MKNFDANILLIFSKLHELYLILNIIYLVDHDDLYPHMETFPRRVNFMNMLITEVSLYINHHVL